MVLQHKNYTPDDTFIYLHYSTKIAHGFGFSFNGNTPSYGVTGPLWALLLSAGSLLGSNIYWYAKALDLVFALAAILVFAVVAHKILRDDFFTLFAVFAFITDAWWLRWCGAGMETSCSVFLVMLSLLYLLKEKNVTASCVIGLLSLIRPEGVLFFTIVLLYVVFLTQIKKRFRASIKMILPFAASVVPWLVFSFYHFGTMIPNTLAGKSAHSYSLTQFFTASIDILKIIGATNGVFIFTAIAGVIVLLIQEKVHFRNVHCVPAMWCIALPIAYAAKDVQVVSRYLLLITPFVIVYGAWALKYSIQQIALSARSKKIIFVLVITVTVAVNQFVYWEKVLPHTAAFSQGVENALFPIAEWLRDNSDSSATVVAPDVGVLGFISQRAVYDPAGLIVPEMKKAFHGISYEEGMRTKVYENVLKPDYIIERNIVPARLASASLETIMVKKFYGLGISAPHPTYYTLYRVKK